MKMRSAIDATKTAVVVGLLTSLLAAPSVGHAQQMPTFPPGYEQVGNPIWIGTDRVYTIRNPETGKEKRVRVNARGGIQRYTDPPTGPTDPGYETMTLPAFQCSPCSVDIQIPKHPLPPRTPPPPVVPRNAKRV